MATATDPTRRYRIGLIVFTTAGISGVRRLSPACRSHPKWYRGNGNHELR